MNPSIHSRLFTSLALFLFLIPFLSLSAAPAWLAPQTIHATAAGDIGFDSQPQVVSDGQGGWLAVWSSNEDILSSSGTDPDIFIARSTDGKIWTFPAFLNRNAPGDTGADFRPSVATDGNGSWVAVWESNEDLNGAGTDRDILSARSNDGGVTWTAPQAVDSQATSDTGSDTNPDISVDASGRWIVVWETDDTRGGTLGSDQDILVATSTDGGATWSNPLPVNAGAGTDSAADFLPTVDVSGNGTMLVAWATDDTGTSNIHTSHSRNGGINWSPPTGVFVSPGADQGQDFGPELRAGDLPGEWMLVWESGNTLANVIGDDQDILQAFSDDDGATWSAPAAVNRNASLDDALDLNPSLVHTRSGSRSLWVVAWSSESERNGSGTDADVWISASLDNGQTWTVPSSVGNSAANDSMNAQDLEPSLAAGTDGQWMAVWTSSHDLNGTLGSDFDLLFALAPKDFFPSMSGPLNHQASVDTGSDFQPSLATDHLGTVVCVWFSDENLNGLSGTDQDIFVARSIDGGKTWSPTSLLNTNGTGDTGTDRDPKVVYVGNNTFLAAWTSNENLGGTLGTDSDLLQSRSIDGGQTWSFPSPLNTSATSDNGNADLDSEPFLASDEQGNLVAVWSISGAFGMDGDIAWARSTDSGQTWSSIQAMNPGAATDNADEFGMSVHASVSGTFIASWVSNNPTGGIGAAVGGDDDLLFRRSTDAGATWSAGAFLNSQAATDGAEEDDFAPRLAADGHGRWIATWYLEGSVEGTPMDGHDVLIARSIDDGATWGPEFGLNNISGETAEDFFPWIATDRAGQWTVAWTTDEPLLGGATNAFTVVVSCSTNHGLTWTTPTTADSYALPGSRNDFSAAVLPTNSGLLTAWARRVPPLLGDSDIVYALVPDALAGNAAYRTWLKQYFPEATLADASMRASIWGTHADPDRDGLVNLIEFFMDLNPTLFDAHLDLDAVANGNIIEATYRRNKAAVGQATGILEWSEDLRLWKQSGQTQANGTPVTITQTALADAGTHERVTMTVTGSFPLFLRLRVILR